MLCDTPDYFNATGWAFSLDFLKVYLTTNMLATDVFNEIKKNVLIVVDTLFAH